MLKKVYILVVLAVLIIACSSSDDGGSPEPETNFDRTALLTNWADNIIIPVYTDLVSKLTDLDAKKNDFIASPDLNKLQALRTSWFNAYKVWQYSEMFNIGKAEEINFAFQMNVYPTNVSDITNNISSQNYDLTSVNNNDAVGFPALDYMLYGLDDTDEGLLAFYTSNPDAANHINYLSDLVDRMVNLSNEVLSSWSTYRNQFINSTSNSASGAINQLVNDYIFYVEKGLRANKIGIPAGNFSATPLPDRVEAYYRSDVSKTLTLESLNAVQNFFNGKAYGSSSNGLSLKAYLDYLNTIKNGEDLSSLINTQFGNAKSKINNLNSNYITQINNDNSKMTEAYDALQAVVVLLKVDMLQALDISVDYVDADGD